MFADDIALLSQEIAQAQELLSRVEMEASKIGLHINAKKTELMTFNYEAGMDLSGTRSCRVPESCPWESLRDTNSKKSCPLI